MTPNAGHSSNTPAFREKRLLLLLEIPQVNGLIESYLRSERTIILAIVPSNQDVATVDILERAKKVRAVRVVEGVYNSSVRGA